MAEPAPGGLRYKAFLSYSHKDSAAAARLHRRLESYRLPKRLVGSDTERGPVPRRLAPIFRDRDELPAVADLSETVRSALAQSAALIVICSPAGAASLWVAEEIRTFRALHPDRPVLAAVLAGEPGDCFPEPLRALGSDGSGHEPLAADFRPGADGERLGLLKLVAGLTAVGLDDLVQRDASRRIRRVTAVTAMALAAMLIMAALTVFALGARREAERQRTEAEGLIEFMLTDLRDRLREVTTLDVLTAVNARALRYYGDQEHLETLDEDALLRRARILHVMGEDDIARGNFPRAMAAFLEARRTTDEQLSRSPDDADRIFAHAQSEYWIGRVHELRQQWQPAGQQFARYAAAAQRLIGLQPDNPDYMMEMGWGAQNLGALRLNGLHDAQGAQRLFDTATYWFGRAARPPSHRSAALRAQANAFGWLADSFYVREMWRPSLAARLRQFRINQLLFEEDRASPEAIFRLAIAEQSVARTSVLAGERDTAAGLMSSAYHRARALTEHDPQNAEWLLFRTIIECELLSRSREFGRPVPAIYLRRNISSAARRLERQDNPRRAEIATCINAHAT
jgi:hypothetical protein